MLTKEEIFAFRDEYMEMSEEEKKEFFRDVLMEDFFEPMVLEVFPDAKQIGGNIYSDKTQTKLLGSGWMRAAAHPEVSPTVLRLLRDCQMMIKPN